MKRHVLLVLGMAFLGLTVLAMAAPNFSGSWVRDNAKSDPAPNTAYWLTRDTGGGGGRGGGGGGGRGAGGGRGPQVDMTIQQDANSLQVTDPQGAIRKYTLDGKPFTKTMDTGIQKATVTANLQGDTLVIGTTQPYGGMPGNATLEVKEVWSLSPDGKILTISTTRTVPAVQKTFKQVYNRK